MVLMLPRFDWLRWGGWWLPTTWLNMLPKAEVIEASVKMYSRLTMPYFDIRNFHIVCWFIHLRCVPFVLPRSNGLIKAHASSWSYRLNVSLAFCLPDLEWKRSASNSRSSTYKVSQSQLHLLINDICSVVDERLVANSNFGDSNHQNELQKTNLPCHSGALELAKGWPSLNINQFYRYSFSILKLPSLSKSKAIGMHNRVGWPIKIILSIEDDQNPSPLLF